MIILICVLFLWSGCGSPFITPAVRPSTLISAKKNKITKKEIKNSTKVSDLLKSEPEVKPSNTLKKEKVSKKIFIEDDLDFALAFVDTIDTISTSNISSKKINSYNNYSVPSSFVRILIYSNKHDLVTYAPGSFKIKSATERANKICRARVSLRSYAEKSSQILIETSQGRILSVLPCTLMAVSQQSYFEFDDATYRGSLIITKGTKTGFSVLNYILVEDYLRGVVPLEIGHLTLLEIEAVKAQAIAARTYTYKRCIERINKSYDLLPTVADQVYGGLSAEDPVSDQAVRETNGQVLLYGDSLVYAFYHSTCGGNTAAIQDVWGKHKYPYLQSISDKDSNGNVFCSISNYYTWKERWKVTSLSNILAKYVVTAYPNGKRYNGDLISLHISDNFSCGRVKFCNFKSRAGDFRYGGDKIRFLIRRPLKGRPILRSSYFSILKADKTEVIISGRGYGHGIGMCQMGAIGRARVKQNFEQILSAYYTGTHISTVTFADNLK